MIADIPYPLWNSVIDMKNQISMNAPARAICVVLPAIIIYMMGVFELLHLELSFGLLTLLLMIYLYLEVAAVKALHPDRWMINPLVVCLFVTFFIGYGFTNIFVTTSREVQDIIGLSEDVTPAMVKLQYFALLAAVALCLGYWSPLAQKFAKPEVAARFQRWSLRGTDRINIFAVYFLAGLGIAARLYSIQQGLYGYGGDSSSDRLAETASYLQYLSLASGAGFLALTMVSLSYYSGPREKSLRYLMYGIIFIESMFGFLSGMKSAVVLPFIVPIMCSYLCQGKVARAWLGSVIVAIVLSYAIIEPFRVARNQQSGALDSSMAITALLLDSGTDQPANSNFSMAALAARGNLSSIGSVGIEFADENEELPSGSPAFLADMFLAPLHAVIPRFIWDSKPLGDLGFWYTQTVLGRYIMSSTAMGPITYLYFAGGVVAIGIVFFLIGVLQRWMWFVLTPWKSLAGGLIFLSLLPGLANVDSAVNAVIINIVRTLPMMLLLVHVLYRPVRDRALASIASNVVRS